MTAPDKYFRQKMYQNMCIFIDRRKTVCTRRNARYKSSSPITFDFSRKNMKPASEFLVLFDFGKEPVVVDFKIVYTELRTSCEERVSSTEAISNKKITEYTYLNFSIYNSCPERAVAL